MQLDEIRDTLLQAQEQQYASDRSALAMQSTLTNQQIMYNNDARGTLYSGIPTWERAQVAVSDAESLGKLSSRFAQNKVNVWNTIQDTVDRIQAMNEAASWYSSRANNSAGTGTGTAEGEIMTLDGITYIYRNGRWVAQ